jgi:hypothetical protein
MDKRPFLKLSTSTTLPRPPPERRLVVTGRIDREQIKLVVDALWEHCDEVAAWQAEVVSCR